ncbi:hypothetical protein AKJ59_00430 [candidate division MSBL1 archaeon SCGC-AAA385M02]|uniref:LamG-like jellyroll fold domain-containing protein n=1 Tax=candidate division MSBL1 archaeon SCGC-AAA385M02 TaxID=1698287 RepID=A0A133VQX3_9EURY|nr:hypothetical protein AKJ59_00430 [candidate division MSBL1 archaeon SCGC-AAA385M02]
MIGYCSATFNDTNWHHIVCTFDSSSGVEALYIDGVSQDTDNKSQSVGSHSGNISMAYNDGDYFDKDGNVISTSDNYNGKIDEFRIYNQTLTAKEVYALYKIPSGNSAKTSRFEAWSHSSDVTKIDGGDIYTGTVTAGKITVTDLADLSTSTGTVNVGNANVKIDGDNTRIIINDGTNDRILIGYDLGGF